MLYKIHLFGIYIYICVVKNIIEIQEIYFIFITLILLDVKIYL